MGCWLYGVMCCVVFCSVAVCCPMWFKVFWLTMIMGLVNKVVTE